MTINTLHYCLCNVQELAVEVDSKNDVPLSKLASSDAPIQALALSVPVTQLGHSLSSAML